MKARGIALLSVIAVACGDERLGSEASGTNAVHMDDRGGSGGREGSPIASGTEKSSARIVAIGDSILAWNRGAGASIPEVVGQHLSVPVENRAVSGALFLDQTQGISTQYGGQGWSWLILNGGANDASGFCRCADCAALTDRLLSSDGQTGAIARFVDRVRATGVKVAFVGYYGLPSKTHIRFDGCSDELAAMRARASQMAESRDGVIFVDATRAVQANDLSMYDSDRIHPSVAGSAAVGRLAAQRILAAGL